MFESGVELRGGGSRRRGPAMFSDAATMGDEVVLLQVTGSAREENRAAARKVLAAGALWDAWIERDVALGSGRITDCGNAAVAELAVRLGCSRTVAQSFAEIGVDLQLRLPATRAAFQAGDLDLARVRAISRETTGLSPVTVAVLEPGIVAAARQLSPGPLAAEIERLIVTHAPDEAAEQRETVQAWQRRIVKRRGRGCATVEVTVSPEEGEALMQLVAEFARTVCSSDPRGAQEKLVDSVLALAHGESYLECRCEREDCDAEQAAALPGRRAPLTQITVDLPTLLGLVSEPAYLHGHGLIDPDLVRRLAESGTWQAMLTELVDLAEELGLIDDRDGEVAEGSVGDTIADADLASSVDDTVREAAAISGESDLGVGGGVLPPNSGEYVDEGDASDAASTLAPPPECRVSSGLPPSNSPPGSSPRFVVRSFLARGSRRAAGPVPRIASPPADDPFASPDVPPASVGAMAEAILAAVRANPALANGVHRDGHGGLLVPPPGALTYRPDAATAALVRARDRHCRFPGCHRPAAQCQLDHIVEYLAWDPLIGGWTIVSNLQCLCAFHHQLKTLGLWRVVTLGAPGIAGHALLWTSAMGTTAMTLPGGAIGAADLSAPRPRVISRRGADDVAAPDTDPEPPPF